MEKKDYEIALDKAKIGLMRAPDSAFFTHVAFSLRHEFTDKPITARTEGTRIEYGIKFFMSLNPDEKIFLLLHETMHCAYMHHFRGISKVHKVYRIAADHVINLQLIAAGFKMPKGGHADPRFKGMSTEEVYEILLQEHKDSPQSSSGTDSEGVFGDDLEEGTEPTEGQEDVQKEIEDIVISAAMKAAMGDKPGTVPGEIQLFLNGLLNPTLPWTTLLRRYMNKFAKNNYSFARPNKRYVPDFYMPSIQGKKLMDFAAFTDISGSVSDNEFHQQMSEVASIMKNFKPTKLLFGQFDTRIVSIDQIKSMADMAKIHFTGRGGTDVTPVLQWAIENKPQLLMIFSDGDFHFPNLTYKGDVLWLIFNNPKFTAPFGRVIHYQIK